MRAIAGLASRDMHQSTRVLDTRHELRAYACYKPAVKMFDERCFDVSEVGRVVFVSVLQLLHRTTDDILFHPVRFPVKIIMIMVLLESV